MIDEAIAKSRKKVEYSRGLRKVQAETELVEKLALVDGTEALQIARDSVVRARSTLAKTLERNSAERQYQDALAGALRAYAYTLKIARDLDAAEQVLGEATAIYEKLNDAIELVRCLQVLNLIQRDRGDTRSALSTLDRALDVDKQAGGNSAAALQSARAALLGQLGEFDLALEAFESGLYSARAGGDILVEVIIQGDRANLFNGLHRFDEAAAGFQAAVELERQHRIVGDLNFIVLLLNFARLQLEMGHYESAVNLCTEGVGVAAAAHLHEDEVNLRLMHTSILVYRAEYVEALKHAMRAYAISQKIAYGTGEARCLVFVAKICATVGDHKRAERYFIKSNEILQSLPRLSNVAQMELLGALYTVAEMRCEAVNLDWAIPHFQEAWERFMIGRNSTRATGVGVGLLMLFELQNNNEAIAEIYQDILAQHSATTSVSSKTLGYYSIGGYELRLGKLDDARCYLESGLAMAVKYNMRDVQFRLHSLLAECYAGLRDFRQAYEHKTAADAIVADTIDISLIGGLEREFEEGQLQNENATLKQIRAQDEVRLSSLERLADAKSTRMAHLSSLLEIVNRELHRRDNESPEAFAQRAEQLRADIQTKLANQSWDEIEQHAQTQYDEFQTRLREAHSDLTPGECRFCGLLRLNHSTADLCAMLNISTRSVQAYRYRIRKKLKLPTGADLREYLLTVE